MPLPSSQEYRRRLDVFQQSVQSILKQQALNPLAQVRGVAWRGPG